jgi:dTDP-4-amino-4,6-dideoxygalactose transaminase
MGLRRGTDACAALQTWLADAYDAPAVALLDSGTHALQIALGVASRVAGPARAIAIPAYACFDVATAAVASGFPVMVYDVDPHTLQPDLDSLAAALGAGAGVAVVAPLYGAGVPWDEIGAMAAAAGAMIVEDAAQSHGSSWRGTPAGCHSPIGVLSFGRGKGWTGGAGGAVLMRGPAADAFGSEFELPRERASSAAILCRAVATRALGHPSRFALAAAIPWLHLGETRYRNPDAPRRMAPAAAALLHASRGAAEVEAVARRQAAADYVRCLVAIPAVVPVLPVADAQPGYLRFAIRLRSGIDGIGDVSRARALGIAPGYPALLPELAALRSRLAPSPRPKRYPGAEVLARELVTLPTHSYVSPAERREIIGLIERYPSSAAVR